MSDSVRNVASSHALVTLRRTIFIVSLPFFILNLMLPIYGHEIGASVVEIGLFFSAFSLMTVLLRPLVGWGLDHFGRRVFFIAGVGGYTITMLSFAFIDQVWILVLARVFQGISSSFLWLASTAITSDIASERGRGRTFGQVAQASSRGSIMGTFLGFALLNTSMSVNTQLLNLSNWALLFIIYSVINLIAFFLALCRLPETNPSSAQLEDDQVIDSYPIHWSRTWILLLLVTLVTGASAAMISPILIIFLQEKLGIGVETLSWAFLPSGLVWALLPSQLGELVDRFGRKPMMLLGLGAAAISSFIIPALGSVIALALLWAFQAACYAAGDPAEQALVADLTGSKQRGRAYGMYVMCNDLGAVIGPLGGTWLYQSFGARAPFYANGVILALCTLILLAFLKIPAKKTYST